MTNAPHIPLSRHIQQPLPGSLMSIALIVAARMSAASDRKSVRQHASKVLEDRFLKLIHEEDAVISAICFSYSGSVAEYDDLRQDALVNIWRGLPSFKGESSVRTWIYRVVLNSCVSTIRKQSRFARESESLEHLYDLVCEQNEERGNIEILHRLISRLGRTDKAMILMWLDEATYEDIADVMGIPRNTVATRLRRIKEKLRSYSLNGF